MNLDLTPQYREVYGEIDGIESDDTTYSAEDVENTFFMLKPDCLERGLTNDVLTYIRDYSEELYPAEPLRVRAMQKRRMTPELVEEHYAGVDEEIMDELHEYFGTDGGDDGYDIVPMVVTGVDAVERVRDMVIEPVDPEEPTFLPENSNPGTIRGDLVTEGSSLYANPDEWPHYYMDEAQEQDVPLYNLVHAADDHEHAAEEIERFFGTEFAQMVAGQDEPNSSYGPNAADNRGGVKTRLFDQLFECEHGS